MYNQIHEKLSNIIYIIYSLYTHKFQFHGNSGNLVNTSDQTIDVKNLEKGIKNLKKPGFNPKNKKP